MMQVQIQKHMYHRLTFYFNILQFWLWYSLLVFFLELELKFNTGWGDNSLGCPCSKWFEHILVLFFTLYLSLLSNVVYF